MDSLTPFLAYLLSAAGLTVLIVWPQTGPSAFLRDRVLCPLLPASLRDLLDCYICCSFWCGLALSPIWWALERHFWYLGGCLMLPAIFWAATRTKE